MAAIIISFVISCLALIVSLLAFGNSLVGNRLSTDEFDSRNSELFEGRRELAASIFKFGSRLIFVVPLWAFAWMTVIQPFIGSGQEVAKAVEQMHPILAIALALSLWVPASFLLSWFSHSRSITWALRRKNTASLFEILASAFRSRSNY